MIFTRYERVWNALRDIFIVKFSLQKTDIDEIFLPPTFFKAPF